MAGDAVRWWEVRVLGDEGEVERWLGGLDPRHCVFGKYEVADASIAVRPLVRATEAVRLLAGVAAGPVLSGAVLSAWDGDVDGPALTRYLADRFPPVGPVPAVPERWTSALRDIARGAPGEPVPYGLFPSVPSKLARLALAKAEAYPADAVRVAALTAYDRGRPYHGHDALACALVHPGVDSAALVAGVMATLSARGWRSRRKTHRLLRWARDNGHA